MIISSTGVTAYAPVPEKKSKVKMIVIISAVSVGVLGLVLFLLLFLIPNLTGADPDKVRDLFAEHTDDVQSLEEVFAVASAGGLRVGDALNKDNYAKLVGELESARSLCDEICDYSTVRFDSDAGGFFTSARDALKDRLPKYEKAVETYTKFYKAYGSEGDESLQKSLLGSSNAEVKALAVRFDEYFTVRKSAIANLEKHNCYVGNNGSIAPCSGYFDTIVNTNSFLEDGSVMKEVFAVESDISIDYASEGHIYMHMRNLLNTLESE